MIAMIFYNAIHAQKMDARCSRKKSVKKSIKALVHIIFTKHFDHQFCFYSS